MQIIRVRIECVYKYRVQVQRSTGEHKLRKVRIAEEIKIKAYKLEKKKKKQADWKLNRLNFRAHKHAFDISEIRAAKMWKSRAK